MLVAVLVVLAGCSGASTAGQATASPKSSTAAPVPTDAVWGTVAPGVDDGGVFDAVELASAHRSTLDGQRVTVRRTARVASPNGTVRRWNRTTVLGPERRRSYTVRRAGGTVRERWTNGSHVAERVVEDGTVTFRSVRPSDGFDRTSVRTAYERSLPGLFASLERARVERYDEREGLVRYRVTGRAGPLFEADSPLGLDPEGGTLTLLVDERGFVPRYALRYEATTRRGDRATVVERVEHAAVGSSEVPRPSWIDAGPRGARPRPTGTGPPGRDGGRMLATKSAEGDSTDMETLMLNPSDVVANARMAELIPALSDAFAAYERGDAQMPAKSYIDLPQYDGDFRSMPAYLDAGDWDAAGIKWVNVHVDNPDEFDLPTVMGTMVYSDPRNAFPLAIMDGTSLTRLRTGAAAAVATDHLAVEDARTLGIVGAGVQSYTQLEGIAEVRPIEEVVVSDIDEAALARFVDRYEADFDVRTGSIEEAAACDVLSTVTPVEEPIVPRSALGEHTHVNAMGADAKGKHEHEDETLLDAKLVIDDYDQTTHSGEINVPWSAGVLDEEDIYAELGEIVVGEVPGREPGDGITLFDSTGLAIQDVAAAHVVYEHARENDNGYPFELVDTRVR